MRKKLMDWGIGLRSGGTSPSLDLNFLSGTMPSGLTFTRASGGGRFNSSGQYEWVGADVPRFDYDPITLACKGLLIEEGRTNLLLDSVYSTMPALGVLASGADIGPGEVFFPVGITPTLVATGDVAGGKYADIRFQGTATGSVIISSSRGTHFAATAGQQLTLSAHVALVAGTLANVSSATIGINEYLDATYQTGSTTAFTPTGSVARVSHSRLLSDADTDRVRLSITIAAAGAVDFTIRVYGPQLEAGAFATSYIPTVASPVTRAADVLTMTGADFSRWFNPLEGTIVAEFSTISNGLNSTGGNGFFWIYDIDSSGAATSSHELLVSATYGPGINARTQVAGTSQAALTTAVTLGTGSTIRYVYAYKTNDFAGSLNGGSVLVDAAGSLPPAPDRMAIGSTNGGSASHLNGHIRRIRYYHRRLDNVRLQELSA